MIPDRFLLLYPDPSVLLGNAAYRADLMLLSRRKSRSGFRYSQRFEAASRDTILRRLRASYPDVKILELVDPPFNKDVADVVWPTSPAPGGET